MTVDLEGPRCDFCSDPNPVWIYPAEDFPLGIAGVTSTLNISTGGWVACAPCSQHIDLEAYDQLAVRAIVAHYERNPEWRRTASPWKPLLEDYIIATHQAFRDNRAGPKAGFG
jgi:hypothetical protein